jgi:hypothetical protein
MRRKLNPYRGMIGLDSKGKVHVFRGFGGSNGITLIASQPSGLYTVQFTQVCGTPTDNGAGITCGPPYGGSNGDPGQTSQDFMSGVNAGLGSHAAWPGVSKTLLSNLQNLLNAAEADSAGGEQNTPLMQAAAAAIITLQWDAANCVAYQINDTGGVTGSGVCAGAFCRSTTRGDNYGNWLQTLNSDLIEAVANLTIAQAQEAAAEQGTSDQFTAGGATYIGTAPAGATAIAPPSASSVAPAAAAAVTPGALLPGQTVPSTILGMAPTTALIGAGVLGIGAYFLLRKKKAPAA